jgi:hypothetical protein
LTDGFRWGGGQEIRHPVIERAGSFCRDGVTEECYFGFPEDALGGVDDDAVGAKTVEE